MDHFNPHSSASFEGYYSKFRLPSGASIALIISAIPGAAKDLEDASKAIKPYQLSFTYVSADSKSHWQIHYWPKSYKINQPRDTRDGFSIEFDKGSFSWEAGSKDTAADELRDIVMWKIELANVHFVATTITSPPGTTDRQDRVPWEPGKPGSTPAGWLADLPLPIQWHVHSVDSLCDFSLVVDDSAKIENESARQQHHFTQIHPDDRTGIARVHIEKNWASTFPPSYIWVQARDHETGKGITLAGGALFSGVEAFLVGYHGDHSPHGGRRFVSFGPPTASSVFGIGIMSSVISFLDRRVNITITGMFSRITVTAESQEGTFFTLAAPLRHGHVEDYCTQSFAAVIKVVVDQRRWPWLPWGQVESHVFKGGSLEFGGDYYKKHSE